MRLFVGEESWHNAFMGRAHVYLDGEKVEKVIGADEELGLVESYKVDSEGHIVTSGLEAAEETRHGDVKIVFDKPPEQLIRDYRRQGVKARMPGIRRKWRRYTTLDRLPMPWHAFNKRAANYFRAICAEQRTIGR